MSVLDDVVRQRESFRRALSAAKMEPRLEVRENTLKAIDAARACWRATIDEANGMPGARRERMQSLMTGRRGVTIVGHGGERLREVSPDVRFARACGDGYDQKRPWEACTVAMEMRVALELESLGLCDDQAWLSQRSGGEGEERYLADYLTAERAAKLRAVADLLRELRGQVAR